MEFFLNPHTMGAIASSGKALSELITDLAELSTAHTVVEFGPGTGVFTRVAQKKMPRTAQLITIECEHKFITRLRTEFPAVKTYEGSASAIQTYLNDNNKTCCDRIISGLPWTIFSEEEQNKTLHAAYNSLRDGGIFVTFTYIYSQYIPPGIRFRKLLTNTFSSVRKSPIVWKNLPPAFVYVCKK